MAPLSKSADILLPIAHHLAFPGNSQTWSEEEEEEQQQQQEQRASRNLRQSALLFSAPGNDLF